MQTCLICRKHVDIYDVGVQELNTISVDDGLLCSNDCFLAYKRVKEAKRNIWPFKTCRECGRWILKARVYEGKTFCLPRKRKCFNRFLIKEVRKLGLKEVTHAHRD